MIKKFLLTAHCGCHPAGRTKSFHSFAPDDPKPDPGGTTTGVASDVPGFVVSAPADLSADDKNDTNKVAAYKDAKKAFDDYTAQAKLEPLAVKLADYVGHNRVAINFMWTLVTGFLVMFMQAGFALVETGLCRAKNASHTMAMNFMIYPMGMLGFYVCGFAFMFGGIGAIGTMGGYAGLNHEITSTSPGIRSAFLDGKDFCCKALAMTPRPSACSCSRWCSWIPRRRSRPAPRPNAGNSPPS